MELKGKLLNPKEVERGINEIRVPIRPIFCMWCGRRLPPIGFNVADEGFLPEADLILALEVCVCRECVKELAEEPEGGWWQDYISIARQQVENIFNGILKAYDCQTLEEFNEEIGEDNALLQMVANDLTKVLDALDNYKREEI